MSADAWASAGPRGPKLGWDGEGLGGRVVNYARCVWHCTAPHLTRRCRAGRVRSEATQRASEARHNFAHRAEKKSATTASRSGLWALAPSHVAASSARASDAIFSQRISDMIWPSVSSVNARPGIAGGGAYEMAGRVQPGEVVGLTVSCACDFIAGS